MCIARNEKVRSNKILNERILQKNENILHSFHIIRNICRAHTVTSNVIFHILFNEIFDVANIICMEIIWSILDIMRMRNYKGTSHCYIIKFKRIHGLNFLSFCN